MSNSGAIVSLVAKKMPGYSDYYITEDARVFSTKRDSIRELSPCPNGSGYYYVTLNNKAVRLHRLVAKTYLGLSDGDSNEVNHKDFDKSNNSVWNLEVVSRSSNIIHVYRAGRYKGMHGESNPQTKLTSAVVREIKRLILSGVSDHDIASSYDLQSAHVGKIRRGTLWSHLV